MKRWVILALLINLLGSASFRWREIAQSALAGDLDVAVPLLRISAQSDDAEIAGRSRLLLREFEAKNSTRLASYLPKGWSRWPISCDNYYTAEGKRDKYFNAAMATLGVEYCFEVHVKATELKVLDYLNRGQPIDFLDKWCRDDIDWATRYCPELLEPKGQR